MCALPHGSSCFKDALVLPQLGRSQGMNHACHPSRQALDVYGTFRRSVARFCLCACFAYKYKSNLKCPILSRFIWILSKNIRLKKTFRDKPLTTGNFSMYSSLEEVSYAKGN